METCQNCVRAIGDDETSYHAGSYIVCEECHQQIVDAGGISTSIPVFVPEQDPLDAIASAASTPARYRQSRHRPKAVSGEKFVICANFNCGYRGAGIKKSRANLGVSLLLLLLGVFYYPLFLFWLAYTIFRHGKYYICPRCGMKCRDA